MYSMEVEVLTVELKYVEVNKCFEIHAVHCKVNENCQKINEIIEDLCAYNLFESKFQGLFFSCCLVDEVI